MRKIQTFMEPGNSKLGMIRMEYTKKFIEKHINLKFNNFIMDTKKVLDVGENNPIGNLLAKYFNLELYNTIGDLDWDYRAPKFCYVKYDVVFCLEVLEHLLSPKYFLMELKKYITKNTQIFISYPSRIKLLWTPLHFHEYDKERMRYLLQMSGYKIIDWKRKHMPRPFFSKHTFKGIRPFIRFFYNPDNLLYIKLK